MSKEQPSLSRDVLRDLFDHHADNIGLFYEQLTDQQKVKLLMQIASEDLQFVFRPTPAPAASEANRESADRAARIQEIRDSNKRLSEKFFAAAEGMLSAYPQLGTHIPVWEIDTCLKAGDPATVIMRQHDGAYVGGWTAGMTDFHALFDEALRVLGGGRWPNFVVVDHLRPSSPLLRALEARGVIPSYRGPMSGMNLSRIERAVRKFVQGADRGVA